MDHSNKPAADRASSLKALGYIQEEDVCVLLGVEVATGRNRQSAGRFPPTYKLGKSKVCRISEVESWIRRRRVAKEAA